MPTELACPKNEDKPKVVMFSHRALVFKTNAR